MFIMQDSANPNKTKSIQTKCSQKVSACGYCSAESAPSDKHRTASRTANSTGSCETQLFDDDDSDSEIFRVKRRLPICMEQSNEGGSESSKFPEQQVN